MGKTVREAIVKDTKKCRYPSKYYVYVLEVTWSEGTTTVVYRRYSDFFEFQCGLLEKFPEEAGAKDPSARIIPFLPGKKLLGRSQVRSVAEKRKDKLNDYCKALVRLPPKLSDDEFVLNFFELRQEDLEDPSKAEKGKTAKSESKASGNIQEISEPLLLERYVAMADYEKQKKNECSLRAGQMVEVIDKNQNGWWFVSLDDYHEGWVPATYLEPLYGQEEAQAEEFAPGQEQYVTTAGYHAQNPDEISFERGVVIDVIIKGLDGWWKVRYKDREGMAPAAYLTRYHGPQSEAANPTELVGSVREAVQLVSGTHTSTRSKPFGRAAYVDQEPIYAPTPRKMSVKKQVKRRLPPPTPSSPAASTSDSNPSSPNPALDGPEPLYEVIPEPEEEIYMTIADFRSTSAGDGLSFSAGSAVTVVTKNPSGWWYVEMGEQEGWVPSSYLERKTATSPKSPSQLSQTLPVKRRQLPQSNRKASLRRSTSEESLTSKAAEKPAPPATRRVPSPPTKPKAFSKSGSHPQLTTPRKLSGSAAPTATRTILKSPSQEESSKKPVRKMSATRSVSTDGQLKPTPRSGTLAQQSLEPPKAHVRSHSAKEKSEAPVTANKPVAELARMLQQRQTMAASPAEGKSFAPKAATRPTPTITTQSEPTRKQPGRPNPGSATAKRVPPKRPEPVKSNTLSSSAGKKAPPRPANSPALKRKASYVVACDYDGEAEGCLLLKEGQSVEVLEKNSDGWWYVKIGTKEGWAPSSFLDQSSSKPKPPRPAGGPPRPTGGPPRPAGGPPRPTGGPSHSPTQPKVETPPVTARPVPKPRTRSHVPTNMYRAAASYQVPAYEDAGINLVAGAMYEVLEKAEGWWYVKDGQKEGWAPASFLDPA